MTSSRKGFPWWILIFPATLGFGLVLSTVEQRNIATSADGDPATAHVERAGDGSCTFGSKDSHCYALALTVHPPSGEPFSTTIDVNVADRWASRIQPGSWVRVVLDRKNPRKVSLNVEAFADPAPTPPATRP